MGGGGGRRGRESALSCKCKMLFRCQHCQLGMMQEEGGVSAVQSRAELVIGH